MIEIVDGTLFSDDESSPGFQPSISGNQGFRGVGRHTFFISTHKDLPGMVSLANMALSAVGKHAASGSVFISSHEFCSVQFRSNNGRPEADVRFEINDGELTVIGASVFFDSFDMGNGFVVSGCTADYGKHIHLDGLEGFIDKMKAIMK